MRTGGRRAKQNPPPGKRSAPGGGEELHSLSVFWAMVGDGTHRCASCAMVGDGTQVCVLGQAFSRATNRKLFISIWHPNIGTGQGYR